MNFRAIVWPQRCPALSIAQGQAGDHQLDSFRRTTVTSGGFAIRWRSSTLKSMGLRGPPELRQLRRRLRRAHRRDRTLKRLAAQARRLAEGLATSCGALHCCGSCGRFAPPPHGRYDGGFCCGGSTAELFCDHELQALALVGVRALQLKAAEDSEHAGCVFRGAQGCQLDISQRPIICLRHYCREAQRELHSRGLLSAAQRKIEAIDEAFGAFKRTRTYCPP